MYVMCACKHTGTTSFRDHKELQSVFLHYSLPCWLWMKQGVSMHHKLGVLARLAVLWALESALCISAVVSEAWAAILALGVGFFMLGFKLKSSCIQRKSSYPLTHLLRIEFSILKCQTPVLCLFLCCCCDKTP